jgi:hypothetical protein
MHSKRIYLENVIPKDHKPQTEHFDKSDLENINTLNLANLIPAINKIQPKQLKVIPESKRSKTKAKENNSSAKLRPNPKNIFLNLKNNIQAENFTNSEKEETLNFFTKKSCVTLGEASIASQNNIIGSPKVSRFTYTTQRRHFNYDTEDLEDVENLTESEDDSLNCSFSTNLNLSLYDRDTPGLKNPRSYGLKYNPEDDFLSPSKVTHKYLPYTMKDDEKYKTRLFSYLRKPGYSDIKTDTRKIKPRKFSELYGKFVFKSRW